MAAQSLEGRPKDSGGGAQEHKFVPGGRVQASEGVYIERAADAALLELCIEGKFGIVLQTRQVGKSSLLTRTSEELRRRGTKTALVDLTSIGTKEIAAEQWYLAVLDSICGQVGLAGTFDIVEWWDSLGRLSHVYRFVRFCSDVLVVRLSGRIVVFVDEIDSTLDLDFSDDFFAAIRDIYQTRDRVPGLPRLSFVFAGSSTPDDLMKDEHRTPFNIGVRVEVTDFTLDETLL
ncbi:MAG: AAA-like domain-containing protein, partial [Polyangiaceae bacterium]